MTHHVVDVAPMALWWTTPLDVVFQDLNTSAEGITQEEADVRLKRIGSNELGKAQSRSWMRRFLTKLTNPLILLMFAAAFLSAITREVSDVIIIVLITVVSIILDVTQEHQADKSVENLKKRVSLTATVLRDGVKRELAMAHLVPGDVVELTVGDIVPADCRVITAQELLVDQSVLTGESYPSQKHSDSDMPRDTRADERSNAVFMGTNVISGVGSAVVVATGQRTEFGAIGSELVSARPKTEFERGVAGFGMLLTKTAIILSAGVFIVHIIERHDVFSSLLFVVALVVGFAPELLPLILTINLSKGAMRMAKHGVIVKRLGAIEDFGTMDILCTDKTGTLTENTVSLGDALDVRGIASRRVLELAYLCSQLQTGFSGPMEKAILARSDLALPGYERIQSLPFDFFRKRLSVLVHRENERLLIVKGAPESVLSVTKYRESNATQVAFTPEDQKEVRSRIDALSRKGLRMIALAYKPIDAHTTVTNDDERDLTYVGCVTFIDPVKSTVGDAINALAAQSVSVKIITGDNELVTRTVCEQIGLAINGVVRGEELEHASDAQLRKLVETTTIFARMNPALKQRVITALRYNGHVVGYVGDGINDAPSLRVADIGISVNNASDIAKETADLILLRKDLHVLRRGIEEGRKIFGNVTKYLKMGMSSNFGNMVSIAVSSLFLPFLPILPVQILLNDLLYDVSQVLLASDRVDRAYLVTPRRWDITSIRQFMIVFGPISSLFDIVTFVLLLYFFRANVALFQTGWFIESLVTQTLIIFSIRTRMVPFFKSKPSGAFALSLFAVVILAIALPFTPVAHVFFFVKPPVSFYVVLVGIIVCYMSLVELTKRWFYQRYDI